MSDFLIGIKAWIKFIFILWIIQEVLNAVG